MTKASNRLAALLMLLACLGVAEATPVEFNPSAGSVDVGDTIAVDIVVTPDPGVFIGTLDIELGFDATIISVVDVLFGGALGGPLDALQSLLLFLFGLILIIVAARLRSR
jgi:hypothetical protein